MFFLELGTVSRGRLNRALVQRQLRIEPVQNWPFDAVERYRPIFLVGPRQLRHRHGLQVQRRPGRSGRVWTPVTAVKPKRNTF